ncbi:MAG: RNA polymerase sigma-70 factor [Bacteroidales bacterium]|jgi:RNA polymerase sigma-70 factor (ECF subfamily)|nr:RNA polymerase sigma-70 factor [Bacteroidales bacterium]MCI2121528.1 RNA polymerase sigma-70 factor [Bacteroidales bacterium]MCI2145530.1 RNA polymerase sigma-70 factor [Bacteroidales bacterium]
MIFYDKKLLQGIKDGDKECFRKLFEENYDVYYSFAKGLLKNNAIAEDIVQDAFMKLWIRRENVNPEVSVNSYVLVMIRNSIYNYMRLRWNSQCAGIPDANIEDGAIAADEKISVDEMKERIGHIVEGMPSRRRQVFEMSRMGNMTNEEISQKMGISRRTVEKHIELALRQIKKALHVSMFFIIMNLL